MGPGRKKNLKDNQPQARPKRRSSLSRSLFSLLLTLGLAGIAAVVALVAVWSQISTSGPLREAREVLIPAGVSTRAIAARLEHEGIVSSAQLVLAAVLIDRAMGRKAPLKAGEFAIPARASIRQVLDILRSGKAIIHKVTIPEGFSTIQVIERLRKHPDLQGQITNIPPEGSLLPETYVFQRGTTRDEILARMQKAQKELLDELWPRRAADLPFKTRREAIILASIVEKETGVAAERPRVAAVFINRLKRHIRLQSDPTIIYGITRGKPLGRPIRKSDIAARTPWNTYQMDGLPRTPIANPGRASIAAVLNPAQTDDIYFVADGTGGHVFANTLEAHNKNVRKWRALKALEKNASDAKAKKTGKTGASRPGKKPHGKEPG